MTRADVTGKHGRRSGYRSNVPEVSQHCLDDLHSGILISVIYLFIHLFVVYLFINLFVVYLFINLFVVYLFICSLFIY